MSNKTKHTPGPWRLSGHDIDAPKSGHEDGVCRMLFTGDPDVDVQVEADARLIAAAPCMLAVLQELWESASYWSEYDVPLGVVDRVESVIAKATGGAV